MSFGVDCIFTILDGRRKKTASDLTPERDVYIMASVGGKDFDGLLLERMAVARQLWKAGIRAELSAKVKPKLLRQFAASEGVPIAVFLGDEELAAGQSRLKVMGVEKEAAQKDRGQLVSKDDLVEEVRKLLATTTLTWRFCLCCVMDHGLDRASVTGGCLICTILSAALACG